MLPVSVMAEIRHRIQAVGCYEQLPHVVADTPYIMPLHSLCKAKLQPGARSATPMEVLTHMIAYFITSSEAPAHKASIADSHTGAHTAEEQATPLHHAQRRTSILSHLLQLLLPVFHKTRKLSSPYNIIVL